MPSIAVELVSAGDPRPVQIVLSGVPSGAGYKVVGATSDGRTWPVPGGEGTSTGDQVVLVDNRAALNTPVTYSALVSGLTYMVQLPEPIHHVDGHVLQSLDGRAVVAFKWDDDGMPRELSMASVAFPVPGRRRPPGRFVPGGDGGGSMTIKTAPAQTRALTEMLLTGRPLVLRTDGQVRDLDPVEIILPQRVSNALFEGDVEGDGVWSWRTWSIEYLLVDDPEPGTALAAFTWADFDTAMTGRTWADFDALFAGSTWDDFDTYDWGQLA
ncbi:hypothetical protein [Actinotalea sp. JY-7876]|uniref:hypothetical protein n=1 Tax=Actinotalea sp. JY-7876 TaxID=2758442 RepID=UPI0015F765D7|nr:hypothetical protein [Actinotalea sp. JY-7876]